MTILKSFAAANIFILCYIQGVVNLAFLPLNGKWDITNSNNSIRLQGNVPGGIYTDLQQAGIINDPYYRFNDVAYRWVSKDDWNYSRYFYVKSDMINSRTVNLICKGLDTVSTIYINDNFVGKSSNMFVQYTFDVKQFLKVGDNKITIAFKSPVIYSKNESNVHKKSKYPVFPECVPSTQHGECHANFIRKIQSEFSWDWGPAFPSVGIWKDIGIETRNGAALRDILVSTVKDEEKTWILNLRIFGEMVENSSSAGTLDIFLENKKISTVSVELVQNDQTFCEMNISVQIPKDIDIQLWWPNGAGKQSLYNLTLVLTTIGTSMKSINIGFRTIELVQDSLENDAGATFYFKINGQPIFMKGSNWIPADSFPERITPEYTRRLLLSVKEANMNVLRVWGGGMYETNLFYQTADELGIMIWQDFMFACALYPTGPEFLNNVKMEITQQVKRLQHHPSILIWSGNNENEAALVQNWWPTYRNFELYKSNYLKLYASTIKPLVNSLDTDRPFVLSSPSNGIKTDDVGGVASNPQSNYFGDVHYYNYGANSWDWTIYPTARFVSEYGFQSWTSFETLSKISSPEDWNLKSKFFDHRQHHGSGNMELMNSIQLHFRNLEFCSDDFSNNSSCDSTTSFKHFIYLTQITQAMGIKTETEHYLRSQSSIVFGQGFTMGALYWQLNDIWQCASWASIEFGGKWKMLHYYAKNFFAPLLVSPYEDKEKLKVSVISDASIQITNLTLHIKVYKWISFKPIYTKDISFLQKPTFAKAVYENDIDSLLQKAKCPGRPYCFMYFTLEDGKTNRVISTNFHFLTEFDAVKGLAKPNIKVTVENGECDEDDVLKCSFNLVLTSEEVAVFVWLEAKGISGYFSDNGFLVVSPMMRLKFHSWEKITSTNLSSKLSITSLMDVYVAENNH